MSKYRHTIHNGVLIRVKRKLLRWWIWSFNKSEEDHLNKMKNRLVLIRQEQALLTAAIPEEEDRIKKIKDALQDRGDRYGPVITDSWSPRTEPVRLKKDIKLGKQKKKDERKPDKGPAPLFNITPTK